MLELRSSLLRVAGLTALGLTATTAAAQSVSQRPNLTTAGGVAPEPAEKVIPTPLPSPTVVGTSMAFKLEPKLELAFENAGSLLWADMVSIAGASFIKPHFVDVNLRKGDVLRVISRTGQVIEEIEGRGPKDMGTFWGLSAFGDELILEFHFREPYAKAPFRIDQVIPGDPSLLGPGDEPESICSPSDFDDVWCYQADGGKWANVMASVGVMNVGGNPVSALWCSGSNVSPQNYLLTNQHCITTQASCDTSEFVFKFYRQGCNNGSPTTPDWQGFRCDEVVAQSPFISCDQGLGDLDYSLCSVLGDPAATFGYVEPDPVRITDGEGIYIIQHPAGRPHEIAHGSGPDVDADGTVLRYYNTLDTEGGSSGSPIFREADDKLVGLHHCGGCSTPGTGNRGMLMADIYPEIESFLCTPTVQISYAGHAGVSEVEGDGDAIVEPGELWQFTPRVRNLACSDVALGVTGRVKLDPVSFGQVVLVNNMASFGDVAAGSTASAAGPIQFRVRRSATCGGQVVLDLTDLLALNGGPFPEVDAIVTENIGDAPVSTLFYDDFTTTASWNVVNGGSGGGTAETWTTGNPDGRSLPLTAPFYIVDSDAAGTSASQDEQLISKPINCSGKEVVELQFTHDFRWYSGGLDEQCDVDIRSSATGGAWVNVANYSGGNASGTVTIDVTAQTANAGDVQVRFHYYNGQFEWWWAVDDVYLLGSDGFECDVFGNGVTFGPAVPLGRPRF